MAGARSFSISLPFGRTAGNTLSMKRVRGNSSTCEAIRRSFTTWRAAQATGLSCHSSQAVWRFLRPSEGRGWQRKQKRPGVCQGASHFDLCYFFLRAGLLLALLAPDGLAARLRLDEAFAGAACPLGRFGAAFEAARGAAVTKRSTVHGTSRPTTSSPGFTSTMGSPFVAARFRTPAASSRADLAAPFVKCTLTVRVGFPEAMAVNVTLPGRLQMRTPLP